MKRIIALHILCHIESEKTLKERYKDLHTELSQDDHMKHAVERLSVDRFIILHGHFGLERVEDFTQELSSRFVSCLQTISSILDLDEMNPSYHPGHVAMEKSKLEGHEEPVLHTPTKVHHHGFWLDILCTSIGDKLGSFVLFILPFYHHPQNTPEEVVQNILAFLPKKEKHILILDKRYSGDKITSLFNGSPHNYLISANSDHYSHVDRQLSHGLELNEWRACCKENGQLISVKCIETQDKGRHQAFVITNAFDFKKLKCKFFRLIIR